MSVSNKTTEGKMYEIFLEKADWIRTKDIVEMAKNRDVSKPTVFRYLRKMVKEGILERDRTEWKKSRYRLKAMSKMDLLKLETLSSINDQIAKGKMLNEEEILKDLGDWISALGLYCVLKQIEKREPFTDVATFYLSYVSGPLATLKRFIQYRETPFLDLPEMMKRFDNLGQYEEYKLAIKRLREALEKLYPKEVETLNEVFTRILSEEKKRELNMRIDRE